MPSWDVADKQEDLIIPHTYTFYDFIINKARGKSGPLFNFDVHEDVRMVSDATREKDESHAGKVVERAWYNRFKHVRCASTVLMIFAEGYRMELHSARCN